MAIIKVQVEHVMVTGVPEDAVTNTWYFDGQPTEPSLTNIQSALYAFYVTFESGLCNLVAQQGHGMKFYDITGPAPHPPLKEVTFGYSIAPAGPPLPTDVAIVGSFYSVLTPGIPRASSRGRVYLGPLNVGLIGADGRFTTTATNLLRGAMQTLMNEGNTVWITHSTTTGHTAPVIGGFCDNEPDTQRRRGRESTARSSFP